MIEPYDLTPEPVLPDLPGSVVVRRVAEDVLDAMSADLLIHAQSCVRAFGDFHLAVSGHSGLDPVYTRLMVDPAYRWLPWSRTQLWLIDETLGLDDGGSRFETVRASIVQHAGIPVDQVHAYVPGAADAQAAASMYERDLREHLGWREKGHDRIDCVIMSAEEVLLDRAHADPTPALVVPYSESNNANGSESSGGMVCVDSSGSGASLAPGKGIPESRVGMTSRLLRSSRMVTIFGSGLGSAGGVQRCIADHELTLACIGPVQGELRWYLDGEAAGMESGDESGGLDGVGPEPEAL